MFLELLAIAGTIIGFICITLSVAAGLYYTSEIIEENIEFTRRLLTRSIQVLAAFLILLCIFDQFPWKLTFFTIFSYYVYSLNLRTFPNVNLTGPIFISTCVLALLNHYLWFQYFSNPYVPTLDERLDPNYKMPHYPSFAEIGSFFGICVWFIPFALFISVSANDNSLPMSATDLNRDSRTDKQVRRSVNLVRYLLNQSINKLSGALRDLGINFKLHRRGDL